MKDEKIETERFSGRSRSGDDHIFIFFQCGNYSELMRVELIVTERNQSIAKKRMNLSKRNVRWCPRRKNLEMSDSGT